MFIKSIRASNMLSKQELSILFINWKDLILSNTKLLKSIRIRQATHQQQTTIGDILCENVRSTFCYQIKTLFLLVSRDDSLHQVLFVSDVSSSSAPETGGDESRV